MRGGTANSTKVGIKQSAKSHFMQHAHDSIAGAGVSRVTLKVPKTLKVNSGGSGRMC